MLALQKAGVGDWLRCHAMATPASKRSVTQSEKHDNLPHVYPEIDGIFLDEMASETGIEFYRRFTATSRPRNQAGASLRVVGNPAPSCRGVRRAARCAW